MKHLTVLRHAKSSWDDPALDDFNRPLHARGWKAARRMGRELKQRGMRFDLVLASTAARVRETVDGVQEKYDFEAPTRFEPKIYMASVEELMELVRALPDEAGSVLLIGHNPGLERLVMELAHGDEAGLRDQVAAKFPTAALAAIELSIKHWAQSAAGCGRIVELILPRSLDD